MRLRLSKHDKDMHVQPAASLGRARWSWSSKMSRLIRKEAIDIDSTGPCLAVCLSSATRVIKNSYVHKILNKIYLEIFFHRWVQLYATNLVIIINQ